MNESTENAPKILYDISLYTELYEMWKVYHTAINICDTSDAVANVSEILSECMTTMLTAIMKDLPIYNGCKSLILMKEDPNLCKKKIKCDDEYCFVIIWHSSGLMRIENYVYYYFFSYIDKKEKEFINELMNRPNAYNYNCSLTNGFDYEFEKIKSNEDIAQTMQENAQNEMNEKFRRKIWRNARGIFCTYRKHFDHNETPFVTRYTLAKVRAIFNQYAKYEMSNKEFIDDIIYIRYTNEQKISSLLKQIGNVEKLIETVPAMYTRFDEFKQHIIAHIVRLMLDEENSELNLGKHGYRYNWVELTPVTNLYPELIEMNEHFIITPGHRLYWLIENILTKYTNFTRQTLSADTICKNTATVFVPTELHTNSILQDISTLDCLDGDTYSIDGIKQVSIPIAETDIQDPTEDYSKKFKDDVDRDDIIWRLFRTVEPVYEENPDNRERIENCIRTTLGDIMDEKFADPNSAEFKQYIDNCKTCIANVKTNIMTIKDALLLSDDPDFIKYLYDGKHIRKREYDARIKQIEEQDNAEMTV